MNQNKVRSKLILYQVKKYGEKNAIKNGLCIEEIKEWRLNEE